jgi:predicted DNA-binding protein
MSLSVRLPTSVEQRLVAYCLRQSLTKSEVLIQAITQYLGQGEAQTLQSAALEAASKDSLIYQAFATNRLIGKVATGQPKHASANKERVAQMARQRLSRNA